MKKKTVTMRDIFLGLRLPTAPPTIAHTNKQNKRVKKFDYKTELKNY